MVDDFNKANISGMENWQSGDELAARKLQQPVDVLKSLGGAALPRQVTPKGSIFQMKMFKVVELDTDVIICNTFDGVEQGTDDIKVALPFLLRKTPFDSATRTDPPRADISYVYSDNNLRKATNIDDEEEDQIIVASYEKDDIIFASKGIFGNTGLYADAPTNEVPIIWLDENKDGRFWAQDDSPPEEEA